MQEEGPRINGLEQVLFYGSPGCRRPGRHTELLVDGMQVLADGARTDVKSLRNLAVRKAVRH
jgi:hypothetical protein